MGIELFVLDDGWFGRRDNDRSSLGDWFVDRRKLPGGLEDVAARVNAKGLSFGLWFEPEMISVESELYRAHPDWCLHVPSRSRSEGRNQLVLDFSRQDVREEIHRQMAAILRGVPIAYVKWDMNRHMTEVGSAALPPDRQQETAHRYILGLYEFMERLTREFPHVLFEGCAGGGGRFDPGILYYMPQIWTSDNTDVISRLSIQYGTSLVYPWSTIAAHVSVVPNHQVGRVTPFKTRGEAAFTGAFGYELDLSILSDEDRAEVKRQTAFYKQMRQLLLDGDLYRLRSPFESNEAAWMLVSPANDEALVTHVTILALPNSAQRFLRLKGLDASANYKSWRARSSRGCPYEHRTTRPLPFWRFRKLPMASQEDALKSGTGIKGEVFKPISFLEFRTESKGAKNKDLAASASSAARFLEIVRVDTSCICRFK